MNPDIDHLIEERGGVVRRAELLGLGIRPQHLRGQIADGLWSDAGAGILVHQSARPGMMTEGIAVGLRMPDAILTGPVAALLQPHPAWNDQAFPQQLPMVIAPRRGRVRCRAVRHPGAVAREVRGLRLADPHTALVDILRFQPWDVAAAIGAAAIRLQLSSVARLEVSISALACAAGAAQLRHIVSILANGAESGPELTLQQAMRRAQIKGWQGNATVAIDGKHYRVDVCFAREKVAVEYDGVAEHSGERAFHGDRVRQNAFIFAGWAVVRVTKQMLRDRHSREALLASVAGLVRHRRAMRRKLRAPVRL